LHIKTYCVDDDNAVAVDTHGKNHNGLLILRNSWGTSVGDYGEFYMSYDYFKLLAFDITRFSKP
jgi:C1A family cysteine protease